MAGGTARADLAPKGQTGRDGCGHWLCCKADPCAWASSRRALSWSAQEQLQPHWQALPTPAHPSKAPTESLRPHPRARAMGKGDLVLLGEAQGVAVPPWHRDQSSGDGQQLILTEPSGWVVPKGAVSREIKLETKVLQMLWLLPRWVRVQECGWALW